MSNSEYFSSDDEDVAGSSFLSRARKPKLSSIKPQGQSLIKSHTVEISHNINSEPEQEDKSFDVITESQETISPKNESTYSKEIDSDIEPDSVIDNDTQNSDTEENQANVSSHSTYKVSQVSNSDVLCLQSQIDDIKNSIIEIKNVIDQIIETVQTLTIKPPRKPRTTKPKTNPISSTDIEITN